jgi:hypothetical protein
VNHLNFLGVTFEEEDTLNEENSSDEEYDTPEVRVFDLRSGRKRPNQNNPNQLSGKERQRIAREKGQDNRRKKNTCNRCGVMGHFATECTRLSCTRCRQQGHEWNKCPTYKYTPTPRKNRIIVDETMRKEIELVKFVVRNLTGALSEQGICRIIQKWINSDANYVEDYGNTSFKPSSCDVMIQGVNTQAIIDSGAGITVMSKGLLNELPYEIDQTSRKILRPFGNDKIISLGTVKNMEIFLGDEKINTDVEIVDLPEKILLFGNDLIVKEGIIINPKEGVIIFEKDGKENYVPINSMEEEYEIEYEEMEREQVGI